MGSVLRTRRPIRRNEVRMGGDPVIVNLTGEKKMEGNTLAL